MFCIIIKKAMNKKILLSLVIALTVSSAVVSLRYINNDNKDLKIGLISSLSGLIVGGDNLGQSFANGALLAHEEYLSANSSLNIELIVEDDGFDSKKGISAYQKLISIDNIDGLINLSSPTIDVISQDVRDKNIPVLQLGAEGEILTDNIFQLYPDQTSIGILGRIADEDGVEKVILATQQIKAYEKFISDFDENFNGELQIERISQSEKNMASLALKIKDSDPDALVVFMGSKEGAQLVKKLREINYIPTHVYFDLNLQLGITDYTEILGDLAFIEGAKSLFSSSEISEEFQFKYKERFGLDAGSLASFGYDSYSVMLDNYDNNINIWKSNMINYRKEGVTGILSFNKQGLRSPEFIIAEIINGELTAN
jgi:ABC-type branched-subunit amino acid transport system substrate-binding protein